jgi:hypothetical protein
MQYPVHVGLPQFDMGGWGDGQRSLLVLPKLRYCCVGGRGELCFDRKELRRRAAATPFDRSFETAEIWE